MLMAPKALIYWSKQLNHLKSTCLSYIQHTLQGNLSVLHKYKQLLRWALWLHLKYFLPDCNSNNVENIKNIFTLWRETMKKRPSSENHRPHFHRVCFPFSRAFFQNWSTAVSQLCVKFMPCSQVTRSHTSIRQLHRHLWLSFPFRSLQGTRQSPCAVKSAPISSLLYTLQSVYINASLSPSDLLLSYPRICKHIWERTVY